MMSVSAHDRIAGRPARAKVLEDFIVYAQKHPGVAFLRKDDIARFCAEQSTNTARRRFSGDFPKGFVRARRGDLCERERTTDHASDNAIPRYVHR